MNLLEETVDMIEKCLYSQEHVHHVIVKKKGSHT